MARRKRVYRKIERRDPRYDSALVGKLISKVMLDGKRSLAERIVYAAIDMATTTRRVGAFGWDMRPSSSNSMK